MDKPRLIAVDDELEMAALIAELGEMVGYESEIAGSGKALLDSEAKQCHNVIVIDLFMPDTDGFELITTLADQGCTAAIILVSGYDNILLKGAGKIADANGLNLLGTLTKPFLIGDCQSITGCCKKHRQTT